MAYSNLGKIFQSLGELQKAEIFTRKAMKLSELAWHTQLRKHISESGELQKAEILRKAIEIDPNFAMANLT